MNVKLILDLYKNRRYNDSRNLSFFQLLKYFLNLKIGEITGRIYKNTKSSTLHSFDFIKEFETIDPSIRETLENITIQNTINIDKRKGLENIGIGCLMTPAMFGNLIAVTQSEASFYFSTKNRKSYKLKLTLLAIPKISGKVKLEENEIGSFTIPTLSQKELTIDINPQLISQRISKITISVDKCWSPHYLDNTLPDFPLGVGVRTIELA